ncbi:hypothetical protein GE09DRAFT_972977 [Coniochaeta sp. 2T2.1]|nr:hypothetical protein GE09DRAFT_972977 [Coniochaeta sp. 2T2.1]
MRAVVWEGKPFEVAVRAVPKPTIELPEDAIVRVTTSAICGSDLHTYRGFFGINPNLPWVMGHEAVGVIVEVGGATEHFKVGDRVMLPWGPDSGHFSVEAQIFPSDYLGYGQGVEVERHLGGEIGGCQAEYIRVPFADDSLVLIPDQFSPDLDWLFLSDIFPTAWSGLDFSGFQPGESVAIFGCGPVGLMTVYAAKLRGASVIYAVDYVRDRLDRAAALGAVPIDFTHSDDGIASQQIIRRRPEGVVRAVDCVGFEAVNHRLRRDQSYVINECIAVTSVNGGVGLVGVYASSPASKSAPRAGEIDPIYEINLSAAWIKNLTIRTGIATEFVNLPVLFDLVKTRRVDLDFVVSSVVSIEDAPKAYERFEKHLETKVVFRFPWTEQQADNTSTPVKAEEKVETTTNGAAARNGTPSSNGTANGGRIVKPENGLTVQSMPTKKAYPM